MERESGRCGRITKVTEVTDVTKITILDYYTFMRCTIRTQVQVESMTDRERAAVFIDLNNVEESIEIYKSMDLFLDYTRLVEVLTEGMDLVSAKAYDSIPKNNQDLSLLHDTLESAGFELVLKKPAPLTDGSERTCVQKEVDTSIVADVVSMAYEDVYDIAVIVTGDRDMRPAAETIERIGRKVVFAACYDVMSDELKEREGTVFIDDLYILQANGFYNRPECRSAAMGCVMKEAVSDECRYQ